MAAKLKQQKIIDAQNVDALMKEYICELNTCPNKRGFCFKVDGVHLKVFPQHLNTWSIGINNDEASIENPPMDLAKMFMPSKSGQVNPFHENVQKSSTPNVAHGSLPQSTPTSGPFHDYGLPPPYFYPPYDMSTPHSQSLHMTTPPDSHAGAHIDLQSSSVVSESEGCEKLVVYINWLARKTPKLAHKFAATKDIILEHDFTFKDLPKLSDAKYNAMGISDGIAYQIKSYTVKFDESRTKGCV